MKEYKPTIEPHDDVSDPSVQECMDKALERYEKKIGTLPPVPVMIGATEEEGGGGELHTVYDPGIKGRALRDVCVADDMDVQDACEIAHQAYRAISEEGLYANLKTRVEHIRQIRDAIRELKYDFAVCIGHEAGKSQASALDEVNETLDFATIYSENAENVFERMVLDPGLHSERNEMYYHPIGPVVHIKPFNFPLALMADSVFAAYLAGCPSIMKPAEQAPLSAWFLYEIMRNAGVDPGMIQYLGGYGETGEELVRNPYIAKISFTGSSEVGKRIQKAAEETSFLYVKQVESEKGGINSIIATPYYDITETIQGIVASAYKQARQKCASMQRLYIVDGTSEKIFYKKLTSRLVEVVKSLEWGHSFSSIKRYEYTPLISEEAVSHIRNSVEEIKKYRKPLLEISLGELEKQGNFMGPVIFEDAPLVEEEVFGPVMFISHKRSLADAIQDAGSVPHITAGLYSSLASDKREFERKMAHCGAGNIYINKPIVGSVPGRQPFGGRKLSGTGKIGYPERLRAFVDRVSVSENLLHQGVLFKDE